MELHISLHLFGWRLCVSSFFFLGGGLKFDRWLYQGRRHNNSSCSGVVHPAPKFKSMIRSVLLFRTKHESHISDICMTVSAIWLFWYAHNTQEYFLIDHWPLTVHVIVHKGHNSTFPGIHYKCKSDVFIGFTGWEYIIYELQYMKFSS